MSKPAIHVFVGAGPANLHRALALRQVDPEAKFVFIDKRLQPTSQHEPIDRERARANIFRFETDDVTRVLLAEGIDRAEMNALSFERMPVRTNPLTGQSVMVFQSGDDKVFGSKPFTQIQIRDLQLLLLKTIRRKSGDNQPLLIARNLSTPISEGVKTILEEHRAALGMLEGEYRNIHIHVASGALDGDEEKDEIIYQDQMSAEVRAPEANQTLDVARMIVTPVHATVTFNIGSADCSQLRDAQISLDNTAWQGPLSTFGWTMLRPPRIRVFYANDILYIGAEIPQQLMDGSEANKVAIRNYTRTIGQLIFPRLSSKIRDLPINASSVGFVTARGQRGKVLEIERTNPRSGELSPYNITTYYHGDSRYLPHYQTGSGFVTAFLENELYRDIYQQKTINHLLTWLYARPQSPTTHRYDKEEVIRTFSQDLPAGVEASAREKYALEAFKAEVFKQCSLEIIEHNQQKVGRYFNALHAQTLQILGMNSNQLIISFNQHCGTSLRDRNFAEIDRRLVAIALLKAGNLAFLREWMPKLLNISATQVLDDHQLELLRDSIVEQSQFSLMAEKVEQPLDNYDDPSKTPEMGAIVRSVNDIVGLMGMGLSSGIDMADIRALQNLKEAATAMPAWKKRFFPSRLLLALEQDLNSYDRVKDAYLSFMSNTGFLQRLLFKSLRTFTNTPLVEKLGRANKDGLLRGNAVDANVKEVVSTDYTAPWGSQQYTNNLKILNDAGLLGGEKGQENRANARGYPYSDGLYQVLTTMLKLGLLKPGPNAQKNFDAMIRLSHNFECIDCINILADAKLLGRKNTQNNFDVLMRCFQEPRRLNLAAALKVLKESGLLSSPKAGEYIKLIAEHRDTLSAALSLSILHKNKKLTPQNIQILQGVSDIYLFSELLMSIEKPLWANDRCVQIAVEFYTQRIAPLKDRPYGLYALTAALRAELNNLLQQAPTPSPKESSRPNPHTLFQPAVTNPAKTSTDEDQPDEMQILRKASTRTPR